MTTLRLCWKWMAAVMAAGALSTVAARAATTTVIYSFAGDDDGEYADTDLAVDAAGNLYGTTVSGGDFGSGTIFELSPTATGWVHQVLYDFTGGADGSEPYKGVTLDAAGNLYGTAVTGGSGSCEGGCGVTYKLTKTGSKWTQSVLHAFTGGDDGSGPGARVTVDRQGNLYGMTPIGGAYGAGTIYELSPAAGGSWTFQVIHPFTGGADGAGGSAGQLLLAGGGRLYGVATAGGSYGSGTAFQLSRQGMGPWTFKTIYSFKGQPDAGFPYAALMPDAAGNLYGTTYYDGAHDLGSVYELSPVAQGEWRETVLYSFRGGKDGNSSIGNVVFDTAGNIYGTTSEGGLGSGTIFELSKATGAWTEKVVHAFRGPPDGAFAYNGMVVDGAGNFYGSTVHGGTEDEGAIYQFHP